VDRHAATQAGSAVQGDGPQTVFIEVLVDFEQIGFSVAPGDQSLAQGREMPASDDHDGAVYLIDDPDGSLITIVR
jgi:hypothetical protein